VTQTRNSALTDGSGGAPSRDDLDKEAGPEVIPARHLGVDPAAVFEIREGGAAVADARRRRQLLARGAGSDAGLKAVGSAIVASSDVKHDHAFARGH
jgi:hypothetical protein